MMTVVVLAAIAAGVALGYGVLPPAIADHLETVTTVALGVMLIGVGMDIGQQRRTWQRLRTLGWRVLLVPLLVIVGTLTGALVAGSLLGLPANESAAVGAGFGWYSLSGVLLTKLHGVRLGTLAFLSNVAREIIAFLVIPLLASRMGNLAAVAPGGATTMDTTLPLIARVTDADTAIVAIVNGTVLSSLVPALVPLLIGG